MPTPRLPLFAAGLLAAAGAAAQSTPPASSSSAPVVRETRREFLDSLADNALTPDTSAIYRQRGARREVDLASGLSASLDERPSSRIDSPVWLPGVASQPTRVFGLSLRRSSTFGDFSYANTSVARDVGLTLGWRIGERWSLVGESAEQRSQVLTLDARRRDSGLGLRWQPLPEWWLDAGVHRASLTRSEGDPPVRDEEAANFWRLRGGWSPPAAPGLTLSAGAEKAIRPEDSPLSQGRLDLRADYTLQPDNPFGPRWAGTRLVWREAPKLGLLSDGQALDARAAYQRSIGVEVPDGSPDGAVYTQWRTRSVASADDQLLVLGWRHGWQPAPRWRLLGHVEQATPLAGPNAVRSFTLGGKLWRSDRDSSFSTDGELVNSSFEDSAYAAVKYTFRLADDYVVALRANGSHRQPHGEPDGGETGYKTSAALGWREPGGRRWAALGRYTFTGTERETDAGFDRRAHIVLGGVHYTIDETDDLTWRWTRRWERDESRPEFAPRHTTMTMARWVHGLGDRWSISPHVARRVDDIDGTASGYGVELGYQLSRKAVLAFGWNPRGFADHELEVDERLKKGLTLRLRFSIDAALARWLDRPRERSAD